MKKMIIAHRGASGYEKENTLESFEKAIELGADMVEFDVRKTKDGELIIIHDPEIAGEKISELSWEEVSETAASQGFHIPKLEELLQALRGRVRLDVELKEPGYETETMELVLRYFNEQEFIVTSFNERSIADIKIIYPNIKTGLLLGKGNPQNLILTRLRELFPFRRAKKIKADWLVPNYKLAAFPFFIKLSQYFDFNLIIWAVNDRKKMEKFLTHQNVQGIITDYPDLLEN